ncbi:hypothetical protein NO932_10170 [Pelagibacterium sp. 26DY04]|uniref:hypothetical protein n=1 Tax=unclassified Pelagibacterium TaxID=2623280 RepID=UPI0028159E1B|nr:MULTISPECIES: hypothetical protein [unclassified Pelagibacterium]WMT85310.1 hypothetical protein NO932_10170 [Pelagibacterium sp. 26DY04]WMT90384.1 hypothetical protein NO934_16580 [Pelagibacterium sp. H642]
MACTDSGGPPIPTDNPTILIYALAALVVLWLVFAMMRKLFGIAIILALVGGAWLLWSNPELLENLWSRFG